MSTSENNAVIGGPQKFYVSATGAYMGSVSSAPDSPDTYDVPADWIEVSSGPSYADQIWLFPGWGPSPSQLRAVESAWRESEMAIALQNVTAIQFEDPDALPGTEAQWKSYWIKLKSWVEGKGFFPDITKRPVRPA